MYISRVLVLSNLDSIPKILKSLSAPLRSAASCFAQTLSASSGSRRKLA